MSQSGMTFGTCQYVSSRVQCGPMESGSAVTVKTPHSRATLSPSRRARSVTADPTAPSDGFTAVGLQGSL